MSHGKSLISKEQNDLYSFLSAVPFDNLTDLYKLYFDRSEEQTLNEPVNVYMIMCELLQALSRSGFSISVSKNSTTHNHVFKETSIRTISTISEKGIPINMTITETNP